MSDTIPPECDVIDHSGGYICPPTDEEIRAYEKWQQSLQTIRELVKAHGAPSLCEAEPDFTKTDCENVEQDTRVLDRIFIFQMNNGDKINCELMAVTENHTAWWNNTCPPKV